MRLGFRYRSNVQVTINNHFAGFGGERRRSLWGWGSEIARRARTFMVLVLGLVVGWSGGGSEVTDQAGFEFSIEQNNNCFITTRIEIKHNMEYNFCSFLYMYLLERSCTHLQFIKLIIVHYNKRFLDYLF